LENKLFSKAWHEAYQEIRDNDPLPALKKPWSVLTFPSIIITDASGSQNLSRQVSCVGVLDGEVFTVDAQHWAPGVFAGTENCPVVIDGDNYWITFVELEKKYVKVIKKLK
jgi:hypothetical protein